MSSSREHGLLTIIITRKTKAGGKRRGSYHRKKCQEVSDRMVIHFCCISYPYSGIDHLYTKSCCSGIISEIYPSQRSDSGWLLCNIYNQRDFVQSVDSIF